MKTLTYLFIFLFTCLVMAFVPKVGGYMWDPRIIVPSTAAMFTLLVWLVARFIGTDRAPLEILVTAGFLAWGFIGNAWDRAWIVWPIASVAYGAIYGIFRALHRKDG